MPVYKDKNGTWFFKVCIKGRQFLRRGFSSKKEATTAAATFMVDNDNKEHKSNLLTWYSLLEEYKKYVVIRYEGTSTVYSYINQVDSRLRDLFPNIRLDKLVAQDVENARKKIDAMNVSVKTKNKHRTRLFKIFEYANTYYGFSFNEINRLLIFRDTGTSDVKITQRVISYDEFINCLGLFNENVFKFALIVFFVYGIRFGELLALRYESFDFENHYLITHNSISYKPSNPLSKKRNKKPYRLSRTKTKSSDRIYPMASEFERIAKKYLAEADLSKGDFIFHKKNDKKDVYAESTFRRHFENPIKKIIPDFHPHMLRHTYVTMLYDKNITIDEIAKLVGHTSSKTTINYYLERSIEKKKKANAIVDELLAQIK